MKRSLFFGLFAAISLAAVAALSMFSHETAPSMHQTVPAVFTSNDAVASPAPAVLIQHASVYADILAMSHGSAFMPYAGDARAMAMAAERRGRHSMTLPRAKRYLALTMAPDIKAKARDPTRQRV